jgi:hypothetical protein
VRRGSEIAPGRFCKMRTENGPFRGVQGRGVLTYGFPAFVYRTMSSYLDVLFRSLGGARAIQSKGEPTSAPLYC